MTIHDLLRDRAAENPAADAILAPARPALSYGGLCELVDRAGSELRSQGLRPNDRLAIVLSNGPEASTAFLAASSCATSAPLNPAYRAEEFEFYLSDLNAQALLVEKGSESVAARVAGAMGLPVIELQRDESAPAGVFTIGGGTGLADTGFRRTGPDDVAVVLHTSGTTSRPKIVPLTHENLIVSATNVAASLALSPGDRCLNVMPLFHIHGLVAALLASVYAGASVSCAPGFYSPRFFDWLEECEPTWYTAVPTMHQAVLLQEEKRPGRAARARLRFIRSSSSALSPGVMGELERVFAAPVIEAYGMTEAAHQMASNPLPPHERKPGSVGIAAGPEIAVMDESGNLLPTGQTGEVVIRGANVMRGYENNPEANAAAFTNGWFRTGDQGRMDSEGYLTLTGRLKEIINRGGEKISPREVDEVLMDHPAVGQAVTFAVPDQRLGEDVGAAIVLRQGRSVSGSEIREFVLSRLASFKAPQSIVFVDEIPKGPTGKLQRIGLARRLGIAGGTEIPRSRKPYEAPATGVQMLLAGIWAEVLRVDGVGIDDDFLQLGGDSILGMQVVSRIRDRLGVELPVAALFDAPALRDQASALEALVLPDSPEDEFGSRA